MNSVWGLWRRQGLMLWVAGHREPMHYDTCEIQSRKRATPDPPRTFVMNLDDPLVARAYTRSMQPDSELQKRKREWDQWRYYDENTKTNFVIGRWWCTCNPKAIGGIWWQQVIDTRTGYKWFYNRTSQYVRPWKNGDDEIRDGYIEVNKVWQVRPLRLPSPKKVEKYLAKRGVTLDPALSVLIAFRATALRQNEWLARLREAWLMVIEGHPERYAGLFGRDSLRNGRYLKWCVTYNHAVDPMPQVQRYEVGLLNTTVPRLDLLRRLADEREAFLQSLGQPLARAPGRPRLAA